MAEKEIGKITHFFNKISVAVIKLSDRLKVGDTIHIKSNHTDFSQIVSSMQVEHQNIETAKPGDDVGIKVDQPVKVGDVVYKVTE